MNNDMTSSVDQGGAQNIISSQSSLSITTPGYFFANQLIFDAFDPSNIDPRASGLNNLSSWKQFYLPFDIVITRWRFQIDGVPVGGLFYAGLADVAGNLIFDIGAIDLTPGAGQYGPGALHDPGTVFFNASRVAVSSISLKRGWYNYVWGGSSTSGAWTMPQMGQSTSLWQESVGIDVVGLPAGMQSRWAHSNVVDIAGGHLPLKVGTQAGAAPQPPNMVFFA